MARSNSSKRFEGEDSAAKRRKNAEAQAAFRQRRSTYIDHLEETVQELHDICLQLNSLFVASHQEILELNAKWTHSQSRITELQQRLDQSGNNSSNNNSASNSTASSHPSGVFSPQSAQSFSPATTEASPPGYDMCHDPVAFHSIFLRTDALPASAPKLAHPHPQTHHHQQQQQQQQPTSTAPACHTPQSWMSELGSHRGTPMQAQPHDLTSAATAAGSSAHALALQSLQDPQPYDWAAPHHQQQQSLQQHQHHHQHHDTPPSHPTHLLMADASALFQSTPLPHLPSAAAAVSPAATYASETPQTAAFAGAAAPLTRSQRFHPYASGASDLYDSHNPCSTGSNVARADSLGVRWSRCDEALQSGRQALHEAQSLKIQRAQSQKAGSLPC